MDCNLIKHINLLLFLASLFLVWLFALVAIIGPLAEEYKSTRVNNLLHQSISFQNPILNSPLYPHHNSSLSV